MARSALTPSNAAAMDSGGLADHQMRRGFEAKLCSAINRCEAFAAT
jgi:hypothetical protein